MTNDTFAQTELATCSSVKGLRPKPEIPDHELLRCIGEGAYGQVWLARNVMGTFRAVKIVYQDNFADERPYEREFNGIQKFEPISRSNEGLVDILQVGRDDRARYFYYVMELADDASVFPNVKARPSGSSTSAQVPDKPGDLLTPTTNADTYFPRTLSKELSQRGRLPCDECLQLGLSLNLALGHLHRHGLLHRDIKPANIIFVRGVPKLADIGLVTEVADARSYVGTTGFIPPEGPNSAQADIYSLGKVLYEISMGKDRQEFPEPFTGLATAADSEALLELNAVILKACAHDPQERYRSAEDMHVDLALLQNGSSVKRKRVLERRLASMTKAGAVAAIVALIAVAAYIYQRHQTSEVKRLATEELRQRQRAEANRELAEVRLYAADMNRAHQALHDGSVGTAKAIMRQHLQDTNYMGFEWRYLWKRCRGDFEFSLSGHKREVLAVTFSADGKLLASRDAGHSLKVWDLTSRKEQFSLSNVTALAGFTQDGGELVLGVDSNAVAVCATATGDILRRFDRTGHPIALLSDGKTVATTSTNCLIAFLDCASGAETLLFPGDGRILAGPIYERNLLSISADGRYLASWEDPDTFTDRTRIAVRDVAAHRIIARHEEQNKNAARNKIVARFGLMKMLPDASAVVWGGIDGFVRFWSWTNNNNDLAILSAHKADLSDLVVSPDHRSFATASADQTIKIWDAASRGELAVLQGHEDRVMALAFSQDGQWLASGSRDRTIKLWNPRFRRATPSVSGLSLSLDTRFSPFSPDGKTLVLSMDTGRVTLFDRDSLRELGSLTNAARPLGFIEHGRKVVTADSANRSVGIWNLSARRLERTVWLSPSPTAEGIIDLSPDAKLVGKTEGDQRLHLYDFNSGRELTTLIASEQPLEAFLFSPNGRGLVTWDGSAMLHFWEIDSRRLIRSIPAHAGIIYGVAFSADGKLLATAGRGQIRIWDGSTGIMRGELAGHRQTIFDLAFSPDGKTLASSSSDGTIKLWSVEMLQELCTLPSYERPILDENPRIPGVCFAPDGGSLWAFTASGQLKAWHAASWQEIAREEQHLPMP